MTLGEVQRVLQQLLREQVSIRDLGAILECLVEAAQSSKNVVHLVETRAAVAGARAGPSAAGWRRRPAGADAGADDRGGVDEHLRSQESAAAGRWRAAGGMPTDFLRRLVESVKRLTGGASTSALPVLLCPSPARYHVRRWLEPFLPKSNGAGAGGDSDRDSGTKHGDGWLIGTDCR